MAASTVPVAASAAHLVPKPYEVGLVGIPMSATFATTSLDDVGDTVELGYLPANSVVYGFVIQANQLAASGLVYKIQIAGVDVVTGLTTGVGAAQGTQVIIPGSPLSITVVSKVQVVITTVATTPTAALLTVTPLYINN